MGQDCTARQQDMQPGLQQGKAEGGAARLAVWGEELRVGGCGSDGVTLAEQPQSLPLRVLAGSAAPAL